MEISNNKHTKKNNKFKIKKIGPYLLMNEIGRGAFAIVYKAKMEKTY